MLHAKLYKNNEDFEMTISYKYLERLNIQGISKGDLQL
jgi:hypothetical protein